MAKSKTGSVAFQELAQKYSSNAFDVSNKHSTGIRAIDKLLGGGTSEGYMYYFYGEPGSGKSTIVLQMIRARLRALAKENSSKVVVFVDVEKAFNTTMQECLKLREFVESGKLVHLTIGNMSDLDEIVTAILAEDGANVDTFVIDSTTMIMPVTKQDLKVEDSRPGIHALQMSFMLNKMKDGFFRCGITSLIICQARANISINGPVNMYAPAYKQAGGYSERHVPDVVFKVESGAQIKDADGLVVGNRVRITTDKNKFAPPKQVISRDLIYGKGISLKQEIIEDAVEAGIIGKSGAGFYTVPGVEKTVRGLQGLLDLPSEVIATLRDTLDSM